MKIVVTFDLHDSESQDYSTAYRILSEYGLSTSTPKGMVLPATTVMGNAPAATCTAFRDLLWGRFEDAGLKIKRLHVAKAEDWAYQRNPALET